MRKSSAKRTKLKKFSLPSFKKHAPKYVTGIAVLVLLVVLTVVFRLSVDAAPASSIETEIGTKTGAVTVKTDASASSGSVIQFGDALVATGTLCSGMTNWSDAASWNGAGVPATNAMVTLPATAKIKVDIDVPHMKRVIVPQGATLCFPDRQTTFSVTQLVVLGYLQAGTATQRLSQKVTFKLEGGVDGVDSYTATGQASTEIDAYNAANGGKCDAPAPATCINVGKNVGTNFITAMNGGKIDFFGRDTGRTWTDLASTANAGSTTLNLRDAVSWIPGDKLILASTDFDWKRQENVTVSSVTNGGKTVTLSAPLAYKHVGISTCQTLAAETRCVDERAEVGLLSHSIRVIGPDDAPTTGFGGHMIILPGGIAKIENTEFANLGQKAKMARYPLHFHILGDSGANSYAKNISLHDNYNRHLDLHGSNYVHLTGMVAVNTLGHGIMFEDSTEHGNVLTNNIVGGIKFNPTESERLRKSDGSPSEYWITNVDNDFIGNHAFGGDGIGFWWDFFDNADLWNRAFDAFTGTVNDNVSHSHLCTQICAAGQGASPHEGGEGYFIDRYFGDENARKELYRNASWKNEGFGWWTDGAATFTDSMAANVPDAVTMQNSYMKGGIMMYVTPNTEPNYLREEGYGLSILRAYHGAADYENIWLAGYGGTADTRLYSAIGDGGAGITELPPRIKNLKFFGTGYKTLLDSCPFNVNGTTKYGGCYFGMTHAGNAHVIYDTDGSIRGNGVPVAVTNSLAMIRFGNDYLYTNVTGTPYGTTNRGLIVPYSYKFNELIANGLDVNDTTTRDSDGDVANNGAWLLTKTSERYFLSKRPTGLKAQSAYAGWTEYYWNSATKPSKVIRHIYDNGGNGGGTVQPEATSLANLGINGTWWYGNGKVYIRATNTGEVPFGLQNSTFRYKDQFGEGIFWTIQQ